MYATSLKLKNKKHSYIIYQQYNFNLYACMYSLPISQIYWKKKRTCTNTVRMSGFDNTSSGLFRVKILSSNKICLAKYNCESTDFFLPGSYRLFIDLCFIWKAYLLSCHSSSSSSSTIIYLFKTIKRMGMNIILFYMPYTILMFIMYFYKFINLISMSNDPRIQRSTNICIIAVFCFW